jgi:hypothetical protein
MNNLVTYLQQLLGQDKTAAIAAVVQVIVALAAGYGLHLTGADVAMLSSLVATGVGVLVHEHFNVKAKVKHQAEHAS